MKNPPKPQEISALRGFTLIELLVVVSIIVILAAISVGVAGFVNRKTTQTKAEAHLKLMEAKIEAYRLDAGAYPQVIDKKGLVIYKMLFGDGVGPDLMAETADDTQLDGETDEGAQVYLAEMDPLANSMNLLDVRTGDNFPTAVIDPWGGPWHYRAGIEAENPDFDLWSLGPDGKDGTHDDVKNW